MTGFGRAKVENGRHEVNVEISSVNKRHLDITFRLPREYQHLESALRRELSTRLFRGQVSVTVSVQPLEMAVLIPQINWAKIDGEIEALRQISEHFGCSVPVEKAALELWQKQIVEAEGKREESSPEVEALLIKGVQEAFSQYDSRRSAEGAFLAEDLRKRTALLREMKRQISQKMEGHVEQIRCHLTQMVEKIVPGLPPDDRILREVVLYADKADISEELSRIDHHLDHVEKVLIEPGSSGKLLEFIFQELLREFNTLGAKTTVSDVSTTVVLAKTELEKMREQVQNVE
jgi:uncharacterized protein (TIGR00255 family)